MQTSHQPFLRVVAMLLCAAVVAGCGGGGSSNINSSSNIPGGALPPPITDNCTQAAQKDALRRYMQEAYFWAGSAPNPEPAPFTSLQTYFPALLFGGDDTFPADRWSYLTESVSYNQFFEEGKTLGYGISVNGIEARLPLRVRYVEPESPAAQLGIQRGDLIESLNGVSAAQLVATGNYAALSATRSGDVLNAQIRNSAGVRQLSIVAQTFSLTPVPTRQIFTQPDGNKVGYVVLKDFLEQSEFPLVSAFTFFRVSGVTDVIVDLRYNGGGLVSTSNLLASLVAGRVHDGKVFTRLQFNEKQAFKNFEYTLRASNTGFNRAVILTGPRTCSASELLANGLRPHLPVTTIGGITCGKPFGFEPVESCGNTVSAVNFESVNALGQGRYFGGIAPTCPVQEDFTGEFGDATEKLTASGLAFLQSGNCPSTVPAPSQLYTRPTPGAVRVFEPEINRGMRAD